MEAKACLRWKGETLDGWSRKFHIQTAPNDNDEVILRMKY